MDSLPIGIVAENLVRGFGSTLVIQNLHLRANKGTIYGLLGPSGCGKTTLLKVCNFGKVFIEKVVARKIDS